MSRARTNADQAHTESLSVVPHIIPDVLYPAVGGKGIDGATTVTSFGTDFAITGYVTLKYYYTDIKGSKPIKDPRIGSHFGSQRHKVTSMQLLEQETATHGSDVYSLDGREYFRFSRGTGSVSGAKILNDASGIDINMSGNGATGQFIEIVGYFNKANILIHQQANSAARTLVPHINGGSAGTASEQPTIASPLGSRFVSAPSLSALTFQASITTPGINTLKLTHNNYDTNFFGVELIAQDTTSTTTKSQIQIPSQNVVSYGKKFTVAETKHYNPFAFKTDGSTAWASGAHNGTAWPIGTGSSTNIDTATSLGLAAWLHSSNYYKPYNGGRVVKWIANDGTIKTSVNMMPPNARSIGNSASLTNGTAKANASIANNTFYPTFEATAVDHSQAEVAKTFHWREFGNGSANRGTNDASSPSLADASMLSTVADDIAYVMDDGLTSLSGDDVKWGSGQNQFSPVAQDDFYYITFIGTGITLHDSYYGAGMIHLAQNLPYGTHILKVNRGAAAHPAYWVDGVSYGTVSNGSYGNFNEVTFYQPKMPPIPEDAVVISDYMLMADHLIAGSGAINISKGVRRVSGTRDVFYQDGNWTYATTAFQAYGSMVYSTGDADASITTFGTKGILVAYDTVNRTRQFEVNGSTADSTEVGTGNGAIQYPDADSILGTNKFGINGSGSSSCDMHSWDIVSPIHTSSHYQTFETPFLHELVGGDRNMEQTNLVVTPDGKTWDEVTRDVGYIGKDQVSFYTADNGTTAADAKVIWDFTRGVANKQNVGQKDTCIAYDRVIILKDGIYDIKFDGKPNSKGDDGECALNHNGNLILVGSLGSTSTAKRAAFSCQTTMQLKRGDYFEVVPQYFVLYNYAAHGTKLLIIRKV